jgi:beta-galactosidase
METNRSRSIFENSARFPQTVPAFRASIILLAILAWMGFAGSTARAALPTPDDGKPHTFAAANGQFSIDGQPMEIIAGEIHPSRIPHEFWEDRIKKARAMGLNTVSVYVFWNQLEPTEGNFNFTGDGDIRRFVQLCQQNGLWVVLRPGPYVCAETEFGGFPAWLLKDHDVKVRQDEPKFMAYCKTYMKALHDQLGDLQITHGGPIIMVQIENELGAIDKYLADNKQMFVDVGFDTQLFTCDHSGGVWNIAKGLPGVLRATNGLPAGAYGTPNDTKLVAAQKVAVGYPIYSSEVYTAWFSIWGGPIAKLDVARQIDHTQWLLDRKLSFCYYVFDGGTNFGFSNGANDFDPVQTTYDYDAPVDELGRVTPKYKALRDLFTKNFNLTLPPIPPDPNVIEIPTIKLSPQRPLLSALPDNPIKSHDVLMMEDIGQNYGFIDYRKTFPNGINGKLDLKKALDYAFVMIDGKVVGEAFAGYGPQTFIMPINHTGSCTLDILVYNLGRNSVGINMATARKGLNENPTLDDQPLTDWAIYPLPMDDPSKLPMGDSGQKFVPAGPILYSGTFNLTDLGETYLDTRNWNFGVIYVNGHNLGRYWNAGGQASLYLPSVYEKKGENQITILELKSPPKVPETSGGTKLLEIPYLKFPMFKGKFT